MTVVNVVDFMVDEGRTLFSEVGMFSLLQEVNLLPRFERRRTKRLKACILVILFSCSLAIQKVGRRFHHGSQADLLAVRL